MSEAGTVAEALGGLAANPDWVLLDLMLPDGSGCAVLKKLAAEALPVKVCVISGAGPAMLEEARSLGAQHLMIKPLDLQRLIALLAA